MADTQLTKMRWAIGLNGLLSIALGVVILLWPGISLSALTILFARTRSQPGRRARFSFTAEASGERGGLILSSLSASRSDIVLVWRAFLRWRCSTDRAYAIALGIIAIGGAFWLPIGGGDTALMILSGLVSILFGIVIFARPATARSSRSP